MHDTGVRERVAIPIEDAEEQNVYLYTIGDVMPVIGSPEEAHIVAWLSEGYSYLDANKGVYQVIPERTVKDYIVIDDKQSQRFSVFGIECEHEHSPMAFTLLNINPELELHNMLQEKIESPLQPYQNELFFLPLLECFGKECLIMNYASKYPNAVRTFPQFKSPLTHKNDEKSNAKEKLIHKTLISQVHHFVNFKIQLLKNSHFVQSSSTGTVFFGTMEEMMKITECL